MGQYHVNAIESYLNIDVDISLNSNLFDPVRRGRRAMPSRPTRLTKNGVENGSNGLLYARKAVKSFAYNDVLDGKCMNFLVADLTRETGREREFFPVNFDEVRRKGGSKNFDASFCKISHGYRPRDRELGDK